MDIVAALFMVALLVSLPTAVIVVGILSNRWTSRSFLVRNSRRVAAVGFLVWGALLIASLLFDSPTYQAVGSVLGLVLMVLLLVVQSKFQSSDPTP